jgi:hypothetical protein
MMTTMSMISPTDAASNSSLAADTTSSTAIVAPCDSGSVSTGGTPSPITSARNFKAHQAATIAAIVESTIAHRHLIPGLADLLGGSNDKAMSNSVTYMKGSDVVATTATNNVNVDEEDRNSTTTSILVTDTTSALGHPSLPSVDAVLNAANRFISEFPPFVAMSSKDSAPQLTLESPPASGEVTKSCAEYASEDVIDSSKNGADNVDINRKLVVKGGMKGYRMSRATHGVSSGCYYYEAIILGTSDESGSTTSCDKRGTKRPLQEIGTIGVQQQQQHQESKPNSSPLFNEQSMQEANTQSMNGHLRIGWSTRLANLQAPVGYNQHSYAIRDIMGSRIHNSHRQDKWGGIGFGPGDVLGVAIYLVDGKSQPPPSTVTTTTTPSNSSTIHSTTDEISSRNESGIDSEGAESFHENQIPNAPLNNHIRFFLNGKPMGNDDGIGFDNIIPGTYHPAISCYSEGSAWLNFGPNFVYPPHHQSMHLQQQLNPRPISDVCHTPPMPEEVIESVISGGSGGKRGGHLNLSRRADDTMVSAFKELVGVEAAARHKAHLKHLDLHKLEISFMRKERGLSTLDLV